ncbi:unnamed protein product, partial [Ectocarpus sp. 12 AP-2014]
SADFVEFERFDITGTTGNDVIYTKGGDDRIIAGAGNDEIRAGAGADTIDGGAGDDIFLAVDSGDVLIGGSGLDRADVSVGLITEDIELDLLAGLGIGGVSWTGIERISGTLGSGNDSVTAGALYDYLSGNAGTDFLRLDYSGG